MRRAGFTFTEILIVVVIIAVLTLIFMPKFSIYQLRANRSDAMNSLAGLQLAEEKYRTSNTTYGTLAQVWTGSSSYSSYYTLAVTVNTATSYTLTATATGTQAEDTDCSVFTLSYANGTTTKSPSACWK